MKYCNEDEKKELRRLIREGRLWDLQDWMKAGKPMRYKIGARKYDETALQYGVEVGFHTMYEELLKGAKWSDQDLYDGLWKALRFNSFMLVELLLVHDFPIKDLEFHWVARTANVEVMERFVELGVDPEKPFEFSEALNMVKAKPLLRFYRTNVSRFPTLKYEMQRALMLSLEEKRVGWSAMLIWAGAEANEPYEYCESDWFSGMNGCEFAVYMLSPENVEKLNLKPTDKGRVRMASALRNPTIDLVASYLGDVSKEVLNEMDGSCRVVEEIVTRSSGLRTEGKWIDGDQESLDCLEYLLARGARWNPSASRVRRIRDALSKKSDRYASEVVRMLHESENVSDELIWEVVRVPRLRQKVVCGNLKYWKNLERQLHGGEAKPKKKRGRPRAKVSN